MICVHRLPQVTWGLPHIFIVLAKCCYHKLQKPTSSSSDQSETSTALHNVSSVSGLLSAPVGHTVIAQRYFSLLLWDFFFLFIADSLALACKSSW